MAVVARQAGLLGLSRDRSEQEFERLYRRHAEDVFRYTLLVLRSRTDAEDATQATFIRAYRALQRGERVRKPQHWLIKIAHRECLRHLRQASRRAVEVELDPEVTQAQEVSDDGPTADEIRVALSHLSFNQRAALVMRELEDRSYEEIAEVLDVSVSAVETLLFRARRALREQMEGPLQCGEAEGLLLKQMDGEVLSADEKRRLRAHTRSCAECRTLERRHRGRRAALKRLGSMITLPSQLGSFFGGGGGAVATATGIAVGAKAAAVLVAALAVTATGVAEAKRVAAASHVRSAERGLPVPDAVTALAFPRWRASSGGTDVTSADRREAPAAAAVATSAPAAATTAAAASSARPTDGGAAAFAAPAAVEVTAGPAGGAGEAVPSAKAPAAAPAPVSAPTPAPAPVSASAPTPVHKIVESTVPAATTPLPATTPAVPAVTVPKPPVDPPAVTVPTTTPPVAAPSPPPVPQPTPIPAPVPAPVPTPTVPAVTVPTPTVPAVTVPTPPAPPPLP